ncbi:MAG TPA: 2,5-dihydroxypyridine 5,6-dioxygenase [Ramlibacter sp.]|uniref:2,5-dihydroxypyridine 5,6-dioxygenase n=1 Tax=Ramlibacter sp. TaxID=1917967 RepID=UPI002BC56E65|nr:2,5-dihydroxypyridine 5,6-dioxygenase [Ramlibacter sp.]HVZ43550.1 2,5-dihydroxypyridine 5,6-dioxygenase [Ramlibacter sp.]
MSLTMKLLDAWKRVLGLSRLESGESVVVLVAEHSHPDHVAAAKAAATLLGTRSVVLELGESSAAALRMAGETTGVTGVTALTGNTAAIAAMKACDFVIDLMGIDRGSEQQEILAAGTRILLVKEPPEIFIRLVPTPEDRERVLAAAGKLRKAKTMHVTSAAGTDFEVALGEYQLLIQYGLADEPGRWDHAPSTFVAAWPNEGSANGTVVLAPGTTLLPIKEYLRTPVRLEIEAGYITRIEGEFDALYLRDYMGKFGDREGYAVSHLGWGLQPKAHWTALGMYDKRQTNAMEARSFAGNFMFSTGPNTEGGGTRNPACHLDVPMIGCSVSLDGEPVVVEGKLVQAIARG